MASNVTIYLKKYITKEDVYKVLQNFNGLLLDDCQKAVLQRNESNVWVYYRGNKFNLGIEELKKDFGEAEFFKTEIYLEISSDEESDYLARDFCENLSHLYGDLYVINGENKIYDIKEIDKAFYL